jgi:nucleotide-binding universal stress UspA family protein
MTWEDWVSFVKILAPLTGGPRDATVLASAISAALPFGAHVSGLFVRADPALAMPFYGEGMSGMVVQEVIDVSKVSCERAADAVRASLARVVEGTNLAITEHPEKRDAPTVSLREVTGNFADCVLQAAKLSDVVVFSAPKDDDRVGMSEAIEAVLLEARRPVLLASKPVAPGFQERIAIGWNASVESAQAVSAALPLLKRAASVSILAVERPDATCADCAELVEYLSLHGVSAVVEQIKAGDRPVADVLCERASALGAGLLVLGGYGHSRWRELFVSSTTRQAIAHAGLPLFLVH